MWLQILQNIAVQAIYRQYHPECGPAPGSCGLSLQAWIVIFGAVQLVISQLPDISDLKELNIFCTCCTLTFATANLGLSIYNGAALKSIWWPVHELASVLGLSPCQPMPRHPYLGVGQSP